MSRVIPNYHERPGEKCLAQWLVGRALDHASVEDRALVVDEGDSYAEHRLPQSAGAWEWVADRTAEEAVAILVREDRVPPGALRPAVAAGQFEMLSRTADAGWSLTRSRNTRPSADAVFDQVIKWYHRANVLAVRYGRARVVIGRRPGSTETPEAVAIEADRQMTILLNWLDEQARAALQSPLTIVPSPPAATVQATTPPARAGSRKKDINGRMLNVITKDPDSRDWSAAAWAERLKCSPGTVKETVAWKSLQTVKAQSKSEAADRMRPPGSRRRRAS